MKPRSDAKTPQWKIDEKNPPSPRAYLALVNRWTRDLNRWTMAIYFDSRRKWEKRNRRDAENDDGDVLNEADAAEFAGYLLEEYKKRQAEMPDPPTEKQIAATGAPVAKNAVRKGVEDLAKAGMPNRSLRRLVPPGTLSPAIKLNDPANPKKVRTIDLFEAGLGREELNAWATDGLSYIQKLQAEVLPELNERVVQVAAKGFRWESMTSDLLALGAKNEAHARLIAQDQVAKLNGKITEEMHKKAGVTSFVWVASYDSRTRQTHRDAHDNTYTWKDGAPNVGFYGESGLPGQAGRCRCTARPVAPDWWNEL